MPLATPYDLPFAVHYEHPRLLTLGNDVFLTIAYADAPHEEAIACYQSYLVDFCFQADIGAMASDEVAPWDCSGLIAEVEAVRGRQVTWKLPQLRTSERAIVLLSQWLQDGHARFPIESVVCQSTPVPHAAPLTTLLHDPRLEDPYPLLWPQVPYPYQIDDDFFEDACIYITWSQPPSDDDDQDAITSVLTTWADSVSHGMYPNPPWMPEKSGVLFDEDDIEWVDQSMEIPFTKFRAHDAALRALLNTCCNLHMGFLPIGTLLVE